VTMLELVDLWGVGEGNPEANETGWKEEEAVHLREVTIAKRSRWVSLIAVRLKAARGL